MKFPLLIIICLLSFKSFAHKDKVIMNNYGNVKVYLRTGFDYSEVYKIKVIGKLSEQLASKLSFKDTLLVEYVNDYTKIYNRDIYSFENNNSNQKFAAGLKKSSQLMENGHGMSLRIYAKSVDIENVLKLIEFMMKNRQTLNSKLDLQNVQAKYSEDEGVVELIPNDLFNEITKKRSDLIEEILRNRIEVYQQSHYGIEITWENNKFIFQYKNFEKPKEFLFEIKDFYYSKEVDLNTMLVFIDGQNFYYLEAGKKTDETIFRLDIDYHRPVDTISHFNNKIIISNGYDSFNIFIRDKRKLITKIE